MTESLSPQYALALYDNCPLPVLVLDGDDRILCFNAAFIRMVGETRAATLPGRTAAQIDGAATQALLTESKRVRWVDASAEPRYFDIQRVDLPEDAHAKMFVDASREVSLDEELRQHVLTDASTGLLNQRGIMLALEPQVARSRRYNRPVSIVMLDVSPADVDGGNCQQVAHLLKDQLRWADLVGCNDQHQFLLVLPETNASATAQLVKKLQALTTEPTLTKAHFGVATWQQNDNAASLLARAASSLAQARNIGTSSVVGL